MRMRLGTGLAGLVLGLMAGTAQASYIVTFTETAAGVLATGAGEINTDLLTYNGSTPSVAYVWADRSAFSFASTIPGTGYFGSFTGPADFGDGGVHYATASQGDELIFDRLRGFVAVPRQYVSGAALSSSMLFANATFASLGLDAGRYTYTYSDPSAASAQVAMSDTIQINVGTVPLPSTAPMLGAALLGLAGFGYIAKRKKAAAAA